MANSIKVKDALKSFLLKMRAMDEQIPEEIAEDAADMTEEVMDALCEDEDGEMGHPEPDGDEGDNPTAPSDNDGDEKMSEKKIEDTMIRVLRKYGVVKDHAMSSLDAAEEELASMKETDEDCDGDEDEVVSMEDEDGEEEVTVDPEKINDSADEVRRLIRRMKPIIANVKDSRSRKILADSVAKMAGYTKDSSQYAAIMKATRKAAADKMSTHPVADADYDFGKEIARKYNPHYMTKEDK